MSLDITETKNATIVAAELHVEDHGMLTCWLRLDYGDSGQGFGGWALYLPKSFKHHRINSFAGHWIWRVMEVAGVDSWDKVVGRTIRVQASHSSVDAIGHITKNDWFVPKDDFSKGNENG